MHLIHVRLRSPFGGPERSRLAALISSYAEEADGLEHVSVHRRVLGEVTLGLFLLAGSLAIAEESAARLVARALSSHAELHGHTILSVGAALVPGPWWNS
ncbi:hypothetical protein LK07_13970 [Streptomyces pluripotens]|uniref:Uncharacterized protein n=1 Tax=Streptomyces pluripotens TaxID=1355015 RepID=A0A221NYA9_9ACTN|nr:MULTISPECIES: hypothetical protein [Streptomyces]ARP70705.1 hypothetical protein LK06_012840 [Streptomyces pluripotens]ASN24967.1 hypothetical protein LK07_13970 [Streptomyces pluripotens]MCH0556597.1 hypothetical protein [Streptomyces sp. MUM 16J]